VVGNVDLARIRDLVGFLACAVVAAPAVGGAIGATVFRLDQGGSWARFAGEWWVGDGLGVLVVGSAIIAWTSRGRLGTLLQPEPLILTGASVVLTVAVFWLEWIALAYVLVGLSVVIAVRLGTLPVAIAGAGVAFVAAQATASGHVFWDDLDIAADTALVHLQLLIALQVSAGLVIAAAVQSRDVAEDEARAAKILAHVDEGVVQVDGRRRIRFWNEAAAAITGVRSADAVGRPIGDVIGGWPALERRLAIAPAPGRTESRAVLPATVSGRELWLSMSGVDYGEGVVYAFRDVTGERRLEELKSDFVATVSHELRTPLTSVYGVLKTLGRPESALTPEQEQALLAIGEREANRLRDLIEQILELPVIEGRAQELESVAVDPCATARAAIESMAAAYPGRPVALEAAAGLPEVAADPARLVQVLTNLLDNALKYSFDGGKVGLAIRQRSRTVVFSVSDEGSGIPPAEQDRIFQKFYRVDPTQTGGVGGTGLGLYISRELVTQMGGAISVESQPGRGATFSVELAVHENAQSHD
jgi:two-component system phosphate regulon sensor histidine kinase PhoR